MTDFDHAVVNVLGKMDEAVAAYERLGFTLTPRGYHTLGSINHLAVFEESYLELLGYAPGEREKRAEMWVHPEGLTGLAFRAKDAAALHALMDGAGVPLEPYLDFSRPVVIDGDDRTASFRTFQIDRKRVSNGRIFFCQHNTPELIWRPQWQNHPNGATGIAAMTIVSDNPAQLKALIAPVPGITAGGSLKAGRTTLNILSPTQAAEIYDGFSLVPSLGGATMGMIGIDIFVTSLVVTAAFLNQRGVSYRRHNAGLIVTPDATHGAILRFVQGG